LASAIGWLTTSQGNQVCFLFSIQLVRVFPIRLFPLQCRFQALFDKCLSYSGDGTFGYFERFYDSFIAPARIPVSVEQISSRDLGCGLSLQSTLPFQTAPAIPTQQALTTGYIPTCNWERDWALQPDGSYLWIGLPPGSPGCEMVGQAGELFQRLVKGENIKLVVNVGNNFVGLNICKGKFTATEVIPGQTCVPMNPELWPKVKGTLIVTESDGFSVGKK
jgi:hypothetical protein